LSNINPIKKNPGKHYPADSPWEDQPNMSRKDKVWFLFSLVIATIAYQLAAHWASHLESRSYYLFAFAVWLSTWVSRHFRLTPPHDTQSRLRAIWDVHGKRTAQFIALCALGASVYYAYHKVYREVPTLHSEDLETLKPLNDTLYKVSGTPDLKKETHRWAFYEELENAPYLTGLTEFKGRVLVVSNEALKTPLSHQIGFVSIIYEVQNPHFIAYRNYMGISQREPLYLVDIRLAWWFNIGAWSLCILLFAFNLLIYGMAVRDENNPSRVLHIPDDLKSSLDDLYDDEILHVKDETFVEHEYGSLQNNEKLKDQATTDQATTDEVTIDEVTTDEVT
jgi:hypothetical protein